jgi:hypothetical protein
MKKLVSVAMALILCLSMVAFAAVPSKPTGSFVGQSNIPGSSFSSNVPAGKEERGSKLQEIADKLIKELSEAVKKAGTTEEKNAAINKFFGFNANDLLGGSGEVTVTDFTYGFADGFSGATGNVQMTLTFDTKFAPGTQVIIAIGLVGEDDSVTWNYFVGTAQEDGSVVIDIPVELMQKIEEGGCLISVVTYTNNVAQPAA